MIAKRTILDVWLGSEYTSEVGKLKYANQINLFYWVFYVVF